ncbi:DUF2637 domain-containing protein [Microbacterium esteraromaticum]|uniref:DUF2637 domain-containing protein n=1 Tax=Microbacterium esteraromaticum TaxID=57043 RepID=UPI002368AD18|nr:DUF2637 domain-containing protein [Microbacterium esteraromaticum]WDH78246.1 DUF2637 domain-containing protein [Microbacterium esteraromaticum]
MQTQQKKTGRLAAFAGVIVGVLALTAFTMSFAALTDLAALAGTPEEIAWGFPVIVDGSMTISLLVILVMRSRGRRAVLAWTTLVLFGLVSVVTNGLHTVAVFDPTHGVSLATAVAMAAVPPVALTLLVELLVQLLQPVTTPVASTVASGHGQAVATPVDTVASGHGQAVATPVDTVASGHGQAVATPVTTPVASTVASGHGQAVATPVATPAVDDRDALTARAKRLLGEGEPQTAVAAQLGISRSTLRRWLQQDEQLAKTA